MGDPVSKSALAGSSNVSLGLLNLATLTWRLVKNDVTMCSSISLSSSVNGGSPTLTGCLSPGLLSC